MEYVPVLVAALIPMVVGFVWYNPNVFGKAWQKTTGMTDEDVKGGNMLLILGLSMLFYVMVAFVLKGFAIHQDALLSLFVSQPEFKDAGSEMSLFYKEFMANYGDLHRTFGHGALHGGVIAIFFALPFIGLHALYERKNWRYFLINVGYWFVSLILMGGLICAWVV